MEFDAQEKQFIRELHMDPVFERILNKIKDSAKVEHWRSGVDRSEDEKVARWIHQSGVAEGINRVVKVLGYG